MRSRPEFRIKRVYEPAAKEDGRRILIDRVWPRGITKQDAALTAWLREIAPSGDLRKWYGHQPSRFEEFRRRYELELTTNAAVEELLHKSGTTTLLYGARDRMQNQAVVLRDYLQAHLP